LDHALLRGSGVSIKAILLCILGAVLLIVAYGVYRARSSEKQLQVDPHAADEIENAKQR
jgi:hypothetical protein